MGEALFTYINDLILGVWDSLGTWLGDHALNIFVILFIAWIANRYGSQLLSRLFHKTIRADLYPTKSDRVKRVETIDSISAAILKIAIAVLTVIMIVGEIGINTAPLLASAGIIGIAIGLGAQSLIKDFTNGIFIILDNQYRVGDVVTVNDVTGTVKAITVRTTVLRALDGTLYHVPNGSITTTANLSMTFGGIEEDILFNSDVDLEKLSLVINRVGSDMATDPELKGMIQLAPYFVRVVAFDANGITVKVMAETTPNDSWFVKGEFYRRLIPALRKAKIKLPNKYLVVTKNDLKT